MMLIIKLSKFREDLRLSRLELHEKGKIVLGIVLPKNSELSPWPKVKRLVSFWWDKMIFRSVTFSLVLQAYMNTV